jgi:hypothetical protein
MTVSSASTGAAPDPGQTAKSPAVTAGLLQYPANLRVPLSLPGGTKDRPTR